MTAPPTIALVASNARYIHTALGARYLQAALEPDWHPVLCECTIADRPDQVVERILAHRPAAICLSVYVWNADHIERIAGLLRAVAPQIPLVMGGPEMRDRGDLPPAARYADAVISGPGEAELPRVLRSLLDHTASPPLFVAAEEPDPADLRLPYHLYTDEDIAHRLVYLETSRGCPHRCAFCLSALDTAQRFFPMDRILDAVRTLYDRGVRTFKFVDRTVYHRRVRPLLDFLLETHAREDGAFAHFEVIPDRIPPAFIDALAPFPAGAIQLEAGVQTFDPEVAARIGRNQDPDKTETALCALLQRTRVHIHADLVVGLPGETRDSFAQGFDRLYRTGVHEIQVGILKRLRGAPIGSLAEPFAMRYAPHPPYEILSTRDMDFFTVQAFKRFTRYFDMVHNSGRFLHTASLLCADAPFDHFWDFSNWMYAQTQQTGAIALDRLAGLLWRYLTTCRGLDRDTVGAALARDMEHARQRRVPAEIRPYMTAAPARPAPQPGGAPARQHRHLHYRRTS